MRRLVFSGGYGFNFQGAPGGQVREVGPGGSLALELGWDGTRWKALAAEEATVETLAPLAALEEQEAVRFVAPVAGVVAAVASQESGALRIVLEPGEGGTRQAGAFPGDQEGARRHVAAAGLWWRIRDAWTGAVAGLEAEPERVVVIASRTEPFSPRQVLLLESRSKWLRPGWEALRKVAGADVEILLAVFERDLGERGGLGEVPEGVETAILPERYPAENPRLLDGLLGGWKGRRQDRTWVLDLEALLKLGELAERGTYETRELLAVGGAVERPGHALCLPGTRLEVLLSGDFQVRPPAGSDADRDVRVVAGGLLTGRQVPRTGHVLPGSGSLTLLPEHVHRRFLSFFRLGLDEDSYSLGFASSLLRSRKRELHGGLRGQVRYCISCGYCDEVCPVQIQPQVLWKLVDIGEVEEAAGLGLMRCLECGLCTYVCPSKLEVTVDLRRGKDEYARMLAEEAAAASGAQ